MDTIVTVDELDQDVRVAAYQWNIWECDADGRMLKWRGSILDPATAKAWIKKFGDPKVARYRINNVPPSAVKAIYPDLWEREQAKKTGKKKTEKAKKAVKVFYGDRVQPKVRRTTKPAAPTLPKTQEQKDLESTASELFDQHKADEAASWRTMTDHATIRSRVKSQRPKVVKAPKPTSLRMALDIVKEDKGNKDFVVGLFLIHSAKWAVIIITLTLGTHYALHALFDNAAASVCMATGGEIDLVIESEDGEVAVGWECVK